MRWIIALLLLAPGGPAAYAQVAARILSVQGRVEVEVPPWTPAAVDQALKAGDTIRTGPQSRAVILLADETQIKLNASSTLQVREVRPVSNLLARVAATAAIRGTDRSTLSLVKGEAWLRSKLKPANLNVGTPAVTAAIRGTEFNIAVADDGTTVATVVDGSIDFRNDQGFVLVNSGEQGRARVGEAPTKTIILNPLDAVQWTLQYTASVSPRDYPFVESSPARARAALASPPADPMARARLQHDAGEPDEALRTLASLPAPSAAETRGWILLEKNRLKEAVDELGRAPASSGRARLGLSLAYLRLNRFEEAYQYVRDPGADDRLKLQKSLLDLLAGDANAARSLLEAVPAGSADYALVQGMLSNVYLIQNDKERALAAAQRALQAAPESPSAHLSLSLVEQSLFDIPAATRSARRALEVDPGFLQASVQYARLLFGAGRSGPAEDVIRAALATAPEEAAAHSALGFILLGQGKTGEARLSFERSLQLDNGRGEPHLGLGIADMRAGRYTDAVTQFLTASTLEPRLSLYQSYLGKAFYEQRKFEQAFGALDAARGLDPRDPTPHLYSGILRNDLNSPGAAIRDFEESIRLNDNRAVYRSRFVLDEDRATRNVNLAAAFNRLGLTEWANLHALRSAMSDPGNSSARIFLANTFLNLRGRTLAAGSELLMARLLLPVNTNSFNAFNDYTTLFEQPRLNWSVEGSGGSFGAYRTTLLATGGARRYAYSSVLRTNYTDGFRPLNDDSRDYTGVNFLKLALTPHSDLLLSYVASQTRSGDHGSGSQLVGDENSATRRNFLRSQRAEAGFHQQFRPGSDFVAVVSAQSVGHIVDDPKAGSYYLPPYPPVSVQLRRSDRTPDMDFQAAHLLKISRWSLKYGVDFYEGRTRRRDTYIFKNPYQRDELVIQDLEPERSKASFRTVFMQSEVSLGGRLTVTAGLNYDWARYPITTTGHDPPLGEWNPQAGFLFSLTDMTTLRFSALRTMQTQAQERLVPSHVAGFLLSQNELPLTLSDVYSFGVDRRFGERAFLRAMSFKRDRTIPGSGVQPNGEEGRVDSFGDFYGGSLTWNQFLTERWTLVPEYTLNHSNDIFGLRHDNEGSLGMYYVHPRGLSLGARGNYLDQHGMVGEERTGVRVFTADASVSFELPRKRGLLSLKVTNIADRRYSYLADPLALDPRVPRRQISALVRINF